MKTLFARCCRCCSPVIVAVLWASSSQVRAQVFETHGVSVYSSYDIPRDLVVADLTNNGAPDIAVANSEDGFIYHLVPLSLYLNRGDGTFERQDLGEISRTSQPEGIAAGFFDQDDFIDLAFAEYGGGRIAVQLGDGAGGGACGFMEFSVPEKPWGDPIDVTHDGGTSTVHANQQVNGGRWNSLGFWSFSSTATVTVRSLGLDAQGNSQTCADAVRLVRVGN